MRRSERIERLISLVNVLILLTITLTYVVTGTGLGGDAIAALSERTVYRGKANGRVGLECAVSWNASSLMEMLDTLAKKDVCISFFVSGEWAKGNPETLRRMAEDGHEIGTLGYAPLLDGSVALIARDIEASAAVIERITGQPVTYYCSGMRDKRISARAAARAGVTHIAASTDALSALGSGEEIANRACEGAFDGSIILIRPTAQACSALPDILDRIAAKGLAPSPVGELLKGTDT